ncbi:hypothetical protein [Microterricola gilva]|uniref:hypothetical protein n=1 Tax=Microterricola gilva TaxID=393267 RepID=UPI00102C9874|nr:hypothetical protein [Microterricola gilva]
MDAENECAADLMVCQDKVTIGGHFAGQCSQLGHRVCGEGDRVLAIVSMLCHSLNVILHDNGNVAE